MPKFMVIHRKQYDSNNSTAYRDCQFEEFMADSEHGAAEMAAEKWNSVGNFVVIRGSSVCVQIEKRTTFSVVPDLPKVASVEEE